MRPGGIAGALGTSPALGCLPKCGRRDRRRGRARAPRRLRSVGGNIITVRPQSMIDAGSPSTARGIKSGRERRDKRATFSAARMYLPRLFSPPHLPRFHSSSSTRYSAGTFSVFSSVLSLSPERVLRGGAGRAGPQPRRAPRPQREARKLSGGDGLSSQSRLSVRARGDKCFIPSRPRTLR